MLQPKCKDLMQTLADPAGLIVADWCFVNTIVFPGDLFKPVHSESEKTVSQIRDVNAFQFFVQYASEGQSACLQGASSSIRRD